VDATIQQLSLIILLGPLVAGLLASMAGKLLGRAGAHSITILSIAISLALSLYLAKLIIWDGVLPYNGAWYTWAISGNFQFDIGFLIDQLSVSMMVVVTFVSLAVHVYTIGYMHDDPGYQRFFGYISLFTFFMLLLIMSNNLMALFVGWEGVGLISYLLIGFWFNRESAVQGSLKAFLVNRVGDFGFLLGIAVIFHYFRSVGFAEIFAQIEQTPDAVHTTMALWPGMDEVKVVTVAGILLFIGAMGKSAQVPLHVWLPESMEGPTPISALIHAATMVTAGIYLVARMSPLFEQSETALSMILIVGATGALFTGILAIVQQDIKRVIAYSTLSQLGYMVVALGASAFAAGMFHLVTHAFFKALLFLAAGSVIIAMHHEQDIRKMGNLRKYMPITYITFLLGSLSLAAVPPFSGFFSKDTIIEAVHISETTGAQYAYWCVLLGAFVTALYTFRVFFVVFHTKERMDDHTREHLHETPWVVWLPLVVLAVPSVGIGAMLIDPFIYDIKDWFGRSIFILEKHNVLVTLAQTYKGPWAMMLHALSTPTFWLTLLGIATAWLAYIRYPAIPARLAARFSGLYAVLMNKYGFDAFNQRVFIQGTRDLSEGLYKGDVRVLDGQLVMGSSRSIAWSASIMRRLQTGYIYHYALIMVVSLLALLLWLILS
jgi:NADH-quinone oxidoreductase subunit L